MSPLPSLPRTRRPRRTAALLTAGVLTLGGALTACGDDAQPADSSSVPASKPFNDADVAFATDMVPHHAQALAMVDLTRGRPLDKPVAALAEQILEAQGPEIQTMTGWLQDWDQPVPETMRDHVNSEDHGSSHGGSSGGDSGGDGGMDMSSDMPGMMSEQEMSDLEGASDADFQKMWLEMMVQHHEGAVEMARTEQADGEYADAKALAGDIVTGQQEEIATMKDLLGS